MESSVTRRVVRVSASGRAEAEDRVVAEGPIEIRVGGIAIAVLMRTPGDDEDLVRGFALTEGIVVHRHEIGAVRHLGGPADGDRYELELASGVIVDPEQFRRNLYATSSCGVCGKASIDAVRIAARRVGEGPMVAVKTLVGLPRSMRSDQGTFALTGGLHAAALFDPDGSLLGLREDVGRHNALDKLVGSLDAWPLSESVLLVSGRVSFEIIQKAAVAGIPVVAAVSAPSSLAIELAEELGITVVGFLRGDTFNLYSNPHRLG